MLFVVGSILRLDILTIPTTFLLIPVLILFYRVKVKKWFLPMVIALLLFYVRDLLMLEGLSENLIPILWCFGTALVILYVFALAGFRWGRIHVVEFISLLIMFVFLGFLYYTINQLLPQVLPSHRVEASLFILLLITLLAISFTQYILKSHYASLWLMLASACLVLSELSLFFKLFIISDISVTIFYPLFHVIAFYAMVQHAVHRRKSTFLPGFWWSILFRRYFLIRFS